MSRCINALSSKTSSSSNTNLLKRTLNFDHNQPRLYTTAPLTNTKTTIPLYAKPNDLLITRGRGSLLYDSNDKAYIDFTAGIAVCALGHADKQIAQIIFEQANTLVHISNLYRNQWQEQLASQLVQLAYKHDAQQDQNQLSHAFLCNSGTEAIEAAIKFSRAYHPDPDVYKILTYKNGFHGRSMGALSATFNKKYQDPFQPLVPGFVNVEYNIFEQTEHELNNGKYCAVLIEPIQGEGGIQLGDPQFLTNLRHLTQKKNVLLIFDEIQCGLSRTGHVFAFHQYPKIVPDILCLAKPLANGVPIGATLVTHPVSQILKQGIHGTTFGGNPLAARVACHVLDRLAHPDLLNHVKAMHLLLADHLAKMQIEFPDLVTDIRGRGLIMGLELSSSNAVNSVVKHARDLGLLICTAGRDGNVLRIVPPLIISEDELTSGVRILRQCLQEVCCKPL